MVGKLKVQIDEELMDLIPGYLERMEQSAVIIEGLLVSNDLDQIRVLGHNMKGSGGGYGFQRISEIGASIEIAARAGEKETIKKSIQEIKDYIKNVEIEYIS